jgi:zinc protease
MGRGPGLFSFTASIPPGGSADAVEKVWDVEIKRIQTEGVSEAEVRRALTQARAAALVGGGGGRGGRGGGGGFGGLQSVLGRANALTQNAVFYNDPNRVNTQLVNIEKVTAEDVKRVANKYFASNARVVLITNPDQDSDSQFEPAPTANAGKVGE